MHDKERLIIDAAIKLFSIKGFDATSIQDIANECGIAKGSFYSYFKSKDELLLETLNYYFYNIQTRVKKVNDLNLEPREKFIKQLTYFFEGVFEHKEFIITQAYEQAIPLNETVKKALYQKQNQTRKFYREGLISIYGNKVTPYLWDLSIMLEGMFHAYIRMFLIDQTGLQMEKLSRYIFNRMDSIIDGLVVSEDEPILTEKEISHMSSLIGIQLDGGNAGLKETLSKLKENIQLLDNNSNYLISIEVIVEELERDNPREAVIKGMLTNLEGDDTIEDSVQELKLLLNNLQ